MDSRASSTNDAAPGSPLGQNGAQAVKSENGVDDTPREITSASQTPMLATTDQPTGSNSRQSSSRPTDPPSAQELSDMAMADLVPYGTRSRNRTGNTRPNYAESEDVDLDFAPLPAKPASTKNATTSDSKRNQQAVSDSKKIQVDPSIARVNGADQDERSPSSSGKEPIPGTSTFSTAAPKKRKAAGAANNAIAASVAGTTSNSATAQSTVKRPASSIPLANTSRETNMMTFEKSKGILRKGGLVADDGTVLHVNGEYSCHFRKFPKICKLI